MKHLPTTLFADFLTTFQASANPDEAPDIRTLVESGPGDGFRVAELMVTTEVLRHPKALIGHRMNAISSIFYIHYHDNEVLYFYEDNTPQELACQQVTSPIALRRQLQPCFRPPSGSGVAGTMAIRSISKSMESPSVSSGWVREGFDRHAS